MPRSRRITPGSAEYYNRMSRAGVRVEAGGRVVKIERGPDGFARERDLGKSIGATEVIGANGQFVPALKTEEGTVVVETGAGTTGQLAHLQEEKKNNA